MPIGFICARLIELSHKVPVALVLMIIERSLKPEHPGLFVRDGIVSVADYNSTRVGVVIVVVVVVNTFLRWDNLRTL